MQKSSRAGARALAAAALACGFLVVVVVVAASLSGDDSGSGKGARGVERTSTTQHEQRKTPAFHVVEPGDTLTAIAREAGVSVARIQKLNPEVDPQVLVSGEKLKLR